MFSDTFWIGLRSFKMKNEDPKRINEKATSDSTYICLVRKGELRDV